MPQPLEMLPDTIRLSPRSHVSSRDIIMRGSDQIPRSEHESGLQEPVDDYQQLG